MECLEGLDIVVLEAEDRLRELFDDVENLVLGFFCISKLSCVPSLYVVDTCIDNWGRFTLENKEDGGDTGEAGEGNLYAGGCRTVSIADIGGIGFARGGVERVRTSGVDG